MTNASNTCYFFFFFNDTATTEIYTLSLHDALPIWADGPVCLSAGPTVAGILSNPNMQKLLANASLELDPERQDRKSTRLNSSHANISYAVFCLKKKKNILYLLLIYYHTRR